MKSRILFLLSFLILANSCVSEKEKNNTINFSGAFALYPLVIKWSEEYKKENEEIRFNISAGGAGKGMADAMAGVVDLGMFSREISETEKAQNIWWTGLCIDAVLPTISAKNPYLSELKKKGITRKELRAIYIEEKITNWGELLDQKNLNKIRVYTRSDACGAAGTWAKYIGGSQENLNGIGIHGDPALAETVSKDPYGIAFNNTAFIYDFETGLKRPGIEVIPIDINNNGLIDPEENFYEQADSILNAIAKGKYPSPPARELYFVANEKPQKQTTLDFIKWCLTSGQKFVKEAGYVPIPQKKIEHYLSKLN